MKRLLILTLVLILTICTFTSCSSGDALVYETHENAESVESLSAQLGIDITVPSTARNVTCSIINGLIANVDFSFNTVLYNYRASKINSGALMSNVTGDITENGVIDIGDRAQVSTYTDEDGKRIAIWYKGGTHYVLSCAKAVSNDTLTELCDLLIK